MGISSYQLNKYLLEIEYHLLTIIIVSAEASIRTQGSNNEIRPPVGGIKRRGITPRDENKKRNVSSFLHIIN